MIKIRTRQAEEEAIDLVFRGLGDRCYKRPKESPIESLSGSEKTKLNRLLTELTLGKCYTK